MDELVCHCFGYTQQDIENDVRANGRSRILERIADAKKLGACECSTKNPKGT